MNSVRRFELLKDLPDEIVLKRYATSLYYVSKNGSIYSLKTNKFLKGHREIGAPYLLFDLWIDGTIKKISQHRLVAETFIPNPNNYPLVRHLDDNPFNTVVENLAWGTKSDNMNDAVRNGRIINRPSPQGEKHRKAKLTAEQIITIRKEINSGVHFRDISVKYGISYAYVYNIKARKVWKHLQE